MLGMATLTMVRSSRVMNRPRASTASATQGADGRTLLDMVVVTLLGIAAAILGVRALEWRSCERPARGTRPLTECAEHFAGGRCCSSAITSFFPALEGLAEGLHLLLGDPQLATLNVVDEAANPLELRALHRHGILAFDQEEPGQAHPQKVLELLVRTSDLAIEQRDPRFQQAGDLVLVECRHKGECGGELRILAQRLGQQLRQPAGDLVATGLGDRVDRSLRPASLAARFLRFDETTRL